MRTVVAGGGVVGTATAWYLAGHGHEVTLVERREEVALETSFGNGGVLHTSLCQPWSRPGMTANALRWMGKADAPFLLRPRQLPHMWRWGLAFARACRPARFAAHTRANLRLSLATLQCLDELRAEIAVDFDHAETGVLKLFGDLAALDAAMRECEDLAAEGLVVERLDRDALLAREPALAGREGALAGGLCFPIDRIGDCHRFTRALRVAAEAKGVRVRTGTTVTALETTGDRVSAVATDRGTIAADAVVVCLGNKTPALLAKLGVRVPICPVKGLTVTLPAAPWPEHPRMPLIDAERLFGLIPIGDRLRVSGSAEITGFDTTPDEARVRMLLDGVTEAFPAFAACREAADVRRWAGLRPVTPQGTPCLGPTRIANLHVNAGHGHLGWTMSLGSAKAVAALVAGEDPGIDMAHLTLHDR